MDSVIALLEKYFGLARIRFESGDHSLAAFFALTTIEECAKVLILRDADLANPEERARAIDHKEKYWSAVINLLTQSSHFDTLPQAMQDEIGSLWDVKKLVRTRNDR